MTKTTIEWADEVWNPVTGYTKVSQGCKNCYAERIAARFWGERKFTDVQCHEDRLEEPLRWKKPRRVFVNSMSDLFHEDVPDEFNCNVWLTMLRAKNHTFIILTKRPERMKKWVSVSNDLAGYWPPAPNVWLGVSVENQAAADERIPLLLQTPAAVRFVSCEPLLGPVKLQGWDGQITRNYLGHNFVPDKTMRGPLDWVIVGGESGRNARPMHPDWARSIRDQCTSAGVPFFFKQHGEWVTVPIEDDPAYFGGRAYSAPGEGRSALMITVPSPGAFQPRSRRPMRPGEQTKGGAMMLDENTMAVKVGKKRAGRLLDGREWNEYPKGGEG